MPGRLIVVAGPSGSGKSSIVSSLVEQLGLVFSVSATTREPRSGEVDGTHYHFVSRPRFEEMIAGDELLEWAEYNGDYYGTPAEPVHAANAAGDDILLEIEIQGARQVRRHRSDALMFFIVPPSIDELRRRLEARGDTEQGVIEARLVIARSEMAEAPELFDHIVVNDVLERATDEIVGLITGSV